MEKMKKVEKNPQSAKHFTTAAAACALALTLALLNCGTDLDTDYDDQPAVLDRTTRQYSIILPETSDIGGVSANPNPAKLGTAITVNYIPPAAVAETEDDARSTENTTSYTITSLTGTYNDGQKTVNFSKGGGGDGSSPCPTLM